MIEHRMEPRRDYIAQVQISFQSDGGERCSITGLIEDRSQSGLGIRVKKPLAVGTEIDVFRGGVTSRYEIKRCVQSGMEYLLGVRMISTVAAD